MVAQGGQKEVRSFSGKGQRHRRAEVMQGIRHKDGFAFQIGLHAIPLKCSQEIRSAIDQIGLTCDIAGLFASEKDYHRSALIDGALPGDGDGLYAGAFTTWDLLAW